MSGETVITPTKTEVTNRIGLSKADYAGAKSTLCTGCGHDSVTNHIISAFYQSSINPYHVAKMSGIGCSSKTPTYFMNRSHGFNSLHGRMAPLSTGAKVAMPQLQVIGVSGDGDSASIGLGGFAHLIRRNLPMVYLVENNGVYGLTKGQFSATADPGSKHKSGEENPFETIDLCSMALDLGCSFVARSFSGDAKQLVPLISTALRHKGTAFIDIISPCVTFANHEGSTKSFHAVKAHDIHLQELGFIQPQEEILVDYPEGSTMEVVLHDGSKLVLKKIDGQDHDIHNRSGAIQKLIESRSQGQILTGLLYMKEGHKSLIETLGLSAERPLGLLQESELRPKEGALKIAMDYFR